MAGSRTRRQLLTPRSAAAAVDTDRLQRLLRVELLLAFTYEHVLSTSLLRPGDRGALAQIPEFERAHAAALRAQLLARGAVAPDGPASAQTANHDLARRQLSGRLGQLQGRKDALYLLFALERVTVGAYYQALLRLSEPALIVLAAQIMAADAQHEAILGELLNPGEIGYAVPSGLVAGQQ